MKKLFNFVLPILLKTNGSIILTVITVLNIVVSMFLPYFNSYFIDVLVYGIEVKETIKLAFFIMGLGLVNICFSFIENMLSAKVFNRVSNEILSNSVSDILKTKIRSLEKYESGYLTQRIFGDINTVVNFVATNYINIVFNVIKLVTVVFIFVKIDVILIIPMLILILLNLFIYFKLRRKLYESAIDKKEFESRYYQSVNSQMSSVKHIQLYNLFEKCKMFINIIFDEYISKLLRFAKISYLFNSIDGIITVIFQSFMFLYGAIKISTGNMTVGEFTMINSYFAIFIGASKYYVHLMKNYQEALSSYTRINEVTNLNKIKSGISRVSSIDNLNVTNLSYLYNYENIFSGLNFSISKNSIFCVTGGNGTGKSTLVKILTGLFDDYDGHVMIDGVELRDFDLIYYRANLISVVSQELYKPSAKVKDLLTKYFDCNVNDELNSSLMNMPVISNSVIEILEKNCTELSGGEIRKLYLWIALREKKQILLLDEPTTGIDFDSKKELINILKKNCKDQIVIVITHDQDLIDISNEIIKLDNYTKDKNNYCQTII